MSNLQKYEGERLTIKQEIIKLHYETIKFSDFTSENWDKVTNQIAGLAFLIGVKNIEIAEINAIIDDLKRYNDLSYWEFTKALQLNKDRKFEEYVEHYGSITNYVAGVVAQYRRFRSRFLAQYTPPKKELTEDEKVVEAKRIDLANRSLMEEIFQELNGHYLEGRSSFTGEKAVKYFNCLVYFDFMPKYEDKERYKLAINRVITSCKSSSNRNDGAILRFLDKKDADIPHEIKVMSKLRVNNIYRGLLVERYLVDAKDAVDDLNELRE